MKTFVRLTAARHYGHDDFASLDKHIDYDNLRAPAQRSIVKAGKEVLHFKNLTEAREYVRDHVLSDSARKKFVAAELGFHTDVNSNSGWKKKSSKNRSANPYAPKKPTMAVKTPVVGNVVITMIVNDQRVKIDCPTTKHAIDILKNL